jgi:HNH endonuclease
LFFSFLRERFGWNISRTRGDQHRFKNDLIRFYASQHPSDESLLYDSSLGTFLPKQLVVAGHIFKNEWQEHWIAFWQDEENRTWDPRNGLLWNCAVESAFGMGKICIYEEDGTLKWHVLDPTIKSIKLSEEYMGSQERRLLAQPFLSRITFGDLEGKQLFFRNNNRPFRSCLCLHAKLTHTVAVQKGWKGAAEWDIGSYYTREHLNLDVAHFLSEFSIVRSGRSSIESLPILPGNDAAFATAEELIAKWPLIGDPYI